MNIKGTAVRVTGDFVKAKFPTRYEQWLSFLPAESREILTNPIYATNWYPLYESVIVPTQIVGNLLYGGDGIKAGTEIGRYSAEIALNGVYKIFVKVSSPAFILSRASSIFASYYDPSDIKVEENVANRTVLSLGNFKSNENLIIYRIAGWIDFALDFTKRKSMKIQVHEIKGENDFSTFRISVDWT